MGKRLEGKVAIVTGGGTGIGEAICKKFAREGAKVVVAGLPDDPVKAVADEINREGGQASSFPGDLAVYEQALACVGFARMTYGQVDILINNAGAFPETNPLTDFSEEAIHYMIHNNILTSVMMSKAALPELQKTKGNLVFAGSEAGMIGIPKNAAYGGTKGYIIAFGRGLAAEQAPFGVRSNVVAPGPIDTAWTHASTGPMDAEMEKTNVQATLLGRLGTPEEVANVYLFLASDEASYVTGAVYAVDGGITIAKGPAGDKADSNLKREPEGELHLHHSREGNTSIRH